MAKIIAVIIVWIAVAIAIPIMKKTQPNDKIYPVWAVFIGIIYTILMFAR